MIFLKVLTTVLAFGFVACAQTPVERDVERAVEEQPIRPFHGGVAAKGFDAIESSTTLSEDQKEQMRALHRRVAAETFGIQREMSKVKAVLFDTIMDAKYQANKVDVLKMKLLKLNDQQISIMLRALEETKRIVGYLPPEERNDFYRTLMGDHFPR